MWTQDTSCLQLLFYNAGDKISYLFKSSFSKDLLSLSRILYVERQDRASCLQSLFYIAGDQITCNKSKLYIVRDKIEHHVSGHHFNC